MKIIYYTAMAVLAFSCAQETNKTHSNSSTFVENWEEMDQREFSPGTSYEFSYGGNLILVNNEGNENIVHPIQSVTKKNNDVLFTAQKIPTELYLRNQGIKGEALNNALAELENEQLFYVDFADVLKQDILKKNFKEGYEEAVSYLAFGVENDFQVVIGSDTLKSNYAHYERSYHLAPYERVLVSFSGADFSQEFQLIYNDILFEKGKIDFQFAPERLLTQNSDPS